jgi:serine phosphatase RsbU (regulator of sigma subunit)
MAALVGVVLAVVLGVAWALVGVARAGRLATRVQARSRGRDGLIQFAEQSLELQSAREILTFCREAGQVIFGSERVVAFEPAASEGGWDVWAPGEGTLAELPAGLRGLFGWFKHNPAIAAAADLRSPRFGAMRAPLEKLMSQYAIDVVMPLVERDHVLAVLGLRLGRRPTVVDRELMLLFRLQATAACANVRLHREAAHMVTLAQEVGLASAVQLALVPDALEGSEGKVSWAGAFQASGEAGSDFWSVYRLSEGRVVMIVGDAVGPGLAGSMISAVVKSCADAIFDAQPTRLEPANLLGALNRALYRSQSPVHTTCFAIVFDPGAGQVHYSNAGHEIPYHLRWSGGEAKLGVLSGAGPLLGDAADAHYRGQSQALSGDDVFVLFTDGLIKAPDAAGKPFGERRLQRLLAARTSSDPTDVRAEIMNAVRAHRGKGPLRDDAALVVVRCR